jgi:O-acetyl-ADP-ribose deacetylase (regulator of RNase III)
VPGSSGFAWGAGHAATLFAFGLPIVLYDSFLPQRVQDAAESAIGLVIVLLALRLLVGWRRGELRFHAHPHAHGALVNTVNTEGVMGKGVALQFRRAYPENYEAYRAACARGEVKIGRMFVYDTGRLGRPRWIINFPTKRHWRSKSSVEDIEAGLADLRDVMPQLEIKSVALPALGAGLGGLRWDDVQPRIEAALGDLNTGLMPTRRGTSSKHSRATTLSATGTGPVTGRSGCCHKQPSRLPTGCVTTARRSNASSVLLS